MTDKEWENFCLRFGNGIQQPKTPLIDWGVVALSVFFAFFVIVVVQAWLK